MTGRDRPDREWGSDLVVDLLADCGFEFATFTPGSSFRGIEESLVNYSGELRVIETPHEGLSVSIAHGYAKATGDPAVCLLHDVVGTLHGSMSLFNAYCDRVPMLALAGAGPVRRSARRPFYDWIHTAYDQGEFVRRFTKWDDTPADVDDAADSVLRALRIARTPPYGPTYVSLDHGIQEGRLDGSVETPDPEAFGPPTPPAPDPDAVERAADLLAEAELPVILVGRVGNSREAVGALVGLAEALGAAVVSAFRTGSPHRYNFPNTHPLDLEGTDVVREADAVLAVEALSPEFALVEVDNVTRERRELVEDEFAFVDVGTRDLRVAGAAGDEFGARPTDIAIAADPRLAVPALREAVRDRFEDPAAKRRRDERAAALGERHDARRESWRREAEAAWDETPVSLPRVVGELGDVVDGDDWVLVNGTFRGWAYRLLEIDEPDRYIGGYVGGGGIGGGIGQAIGGALAYEDERPAINLQPDGDLMMYPGGLWTIAHYGLPMLSVVHNNGSMYNSTNHRMELAAHRGRDASYESALVGTGLGDPVPDYAAMAESMGVAGYGPIEEPDDVAPALEAAWADVQRGEPALVDVVCQAR